MHDSAIAVSESVGQEFGVVDSPVSRNGHVPNRTAVQAPATGSGIQLPTAERRSGSEPRTNTHRTSRRINSLTGVQILSVGSYVPDQVVTNEDLQRQYGFDPEWIVQRTGIQARRHCLPGQATSDLCVEAARKAIRNARVDPADIDLVIVGTFTPDYSFPSTACLVQDKLNLDASAFDLQAACAGFMYALVTGAQYVASGSSKLALVIGADCNSRVVNPLDQRTAPLFGDGAGAVLLAPGDPHQGLLCYQIGADGGGGPLLNRPSGGSKAPLTHADLDAGLHYMHMDGRNVFKWAVRMVTDTVELMLNQTGLDSHDVALYVLHQANIRIIDSAAEQLGLPQDKIFTNLHKYGNTSGGSIPIALDEAWQAGRISRGDTLLMSGFGAGLTWGTALFRW